MALLEMLSSAAGLASWIQSTSDYSTRAWLTASLIVSCAVYTKYTMRQIRHTGLQLLVAVPALVVNAWVPLLFSRHTEVLTRTSLVLSTTWLANFKVLGICMRRGPLMKEWTLPQFVVLYGMPVYPSQGGASKGRLADSAGSTLDIVKNILLNAALLVVATYVLMQVDLPVSAKHYVYALGLCSFITVLMSACASLLVALLGLQLVPPFDNPWFMTSLSDYWARRWNVTTSSLLRAVVYDPIEEGQLVKQAPMAATTPPLQPQQQAAGQGNAEPGVVKQQQQQQQQQKQPQHCTSRSRQLLGMTASFVTSGIMHEIILQYIVDEYRPGYWFMFFTIQAPLCAAETALRRALKAQGRPLPKLVSMAIPNVLMLITAKLFFFPPIEPTGLATLVVDSVAVNIQRLVAAVQATVPLSMLIGQMSGMGE